MIYIYPLIALLICFIGYANTVGWKQKIFMYIGAPIDVFVNATYFTIVYLDIPKEWTLTLRTRRLKSVGGYRGFVANHLCNFLNWIMKGHCV